MTTETNEPASLFDRVLTLLRSHGQREGEVTQTQREALIDLLVWTMFADRHVAVPEQNYIHRQAGDLTWESPRAVELYINGAVRRTRDVLGSVGAESAYLDDIADRLADTEMRRIAYGACQELAGVDGERAPAELDLLERMRRRFDL
jgi:hypothetical protein